MKGFLKQIEFKLCQAYASILKSDLDVNAFRLSANQTVYVLYDTYVELIQLQAKGHSTNSWNYGAGILKDLL